MWADYPSRLPGHFRLILVWRVRPFTTQTVVGALSDIAEPIDMVDIFRNSGRRAQQSTKPSLSVRNQSGHNKGHQRAAAESRNTPD